MTMSAKQAAAYIDHTLLRADATREAVLELCDQAMRYSFASVCVNPCHVPHVAARLEGSGVKACTVIGFPLGCSTPAVKAFEARQAVLGGALEVDMVLNIGALKGGRIDEAERDVRVVTESAKAAHPACVVKVIIETCLLSDQEKDDVCQMLLSTGADFVKTSTGFSTGGATVEDIVRLRKNVRDRMMIKASGGIRTHHDFLAMVAAGADRIGTSNGVAIIEGLKG